MAKIAIIIHKKDNETQFRVSIQCLCGCGDIFQPCDGCLFDTLLEAEKFCGELAKQLGLKREALN